MTAQALRKQRELYNVFLANGDNGDAAEARNDGGKKALLAVTLLGISGFIIANYTRQTIWPSFLLSVPLKAWNLIHALSAMAFAGGVVTTTLLEWTLPNLKVQEQEQNSLLKWLWQVESLLVLPAVCTSLISGVAQSFHSYRSLRYAPRHVKSALHLMFLFGLWWIWADRGSQATLEAEVDLRTLHRRRIYNVVSCAFLVALYSIMILKPGYRP